MDRLDIVSPLKAPYSNQDEIYLQQLLRLYHLRLMTNQGLLRQLQSCGVAIEVLEAAGAGWCDRALGELVASSSQTQADICRGTLRRMGLLRPSGHQLLLGCVVVPTIGRNGKILGVEGCRIAKWVPKEKPVKITWRRGDEMVLSSKLMEAIDHAFHP